MPIETKDLKAGLAFIQDGKRVAIPKADNYAVRPVAGGQFMKANGADTVKELREQFPNCRFLWLSEPFDQKAAKETKPESETVPPSGS
jgi:hypothetical protein